MLIAAPAAAAGQTVIGMRYGLGSGPNEHARLAAHLDHSLTDRIAAVVELESHTVLEECPLTFPERVRCDYAGWLGLGGVALTTVNDGDGLQLAASVRALAGLFIGTADLFMPVGGVAADVGVDLARPLRITASVRQLVVRDHPYFSIFGSLPAPRSISMGLALRLP